MAAAKRKEPPDETEQLTCQLASSSVAPTLPSPVAEVAVNINGKQAIQPICKHKHRRVYARGLCGPCYQSARLHGKFEAGITRKNGTTRMRIKQATKCGHPDRVHYAKDLCQQCYQKLRRDERSAQKAKREVPRIDAAKSVESKVCNEQAQPVKQAPKKQDKRVKSHEISVKDDKEKAPKRGPSVPKSSDRPVAPTKADMQLAELEVCGEIANLSHAKPQSPDRQEEPVPTVSPAVQRVSVVPKHCVPVSLLTGSHDDVIHTEPPTRAPTSSLPLSTQSVMNQIPIDSPHMFGAVAPDPGHKDKTATDLLSQLAAEGRQQSSHSKQEQSTNAAENTQSLLGESVMVPGATLAPADQLNPEGNDTQPVMMPWPVIPLLPRSENATAKLAHSPESIVDLTGLDKLVETINHVQYESRSRTATNAEVPTPGTSAFSSPRKRLKGSIKSPSLKKADSQPASPAPCRFPFEPMHPLPEDRPSDFPMWRNSLFGGMHPQQSPPPPQGQVQAMSQGQMADPLGVVHTGGPGYAQYMALHGLQPTSLDEFLV